MSAHTPGPWGLPNQYVKVRKCNFLSHVHWDDEEGVANARLIAAAPDLLVALRDLVANLAEGDFISETRIDAARAAIAKAVQS
jgi:hypothetical protein